MSTKKISGVHEGVFETLHTVMHLYRAAMLREVRAAEGALTPMEYKTLGYFSRHPGATLSDLVAHSGRDKAQLARIVKDLKNKGLLETARDEADRRASRLTPTAAGQAISEAVLARSRETLGRGMAGLSAAECATLQSLLERIRQNLEGSGDAV